MFYFLFEYLELEYQIPGASLFKYLSFRSALAFVFSLMLSVKYGKNIINFLKKKQIGETVRDLGLDGQKEKEGTPTMGGLIIIIATIVPVILFSKFNNIFMLPHIGSATVKTRDAMGFRALNNLDSYFAGKTPADIL